MAYPENIEPISSEELEEAASDSLVSETTLGLSTESSIETTRAKTWKCVISGQVIKKPNCIPENKGDHDGLSTSIGMVHISMMDRYYNDAVARALRESKDRNSKNLRERVLRIVKEKKELERRRVASIYDGTLGEA